MSHCQNSMKIQRCFWNPGFDGILMMRFVFDSTYLLTTAAYCWEGMMYFFFLSLMKEKKKLFFFKLFLKNCFCFCISRYLRPSCIHLAKSRQNVEVFRLMFTATKMFIQSSCKYYGFVFMWVTLKCYLPWRGRRGMFVRLCWRQLLLGQRIQWHPYVQRFAEVYKHRFILDVPVPMKKKMYVVFFC